MAITLPQHAFFDVFLFLVSASFGASQDLSFFADMGDFAICLRARDAVDHGTLLILDDLDDFGRMGVSGEQKMMWEAAFQELGGSTSYIVVRPHLSWVSLLLDATINVHMGKQQDISLKLHIILDFMQKQQFQGNALDSVAGVDQNDWVPLLRWLCHKYQHDPDDSEGRRGYRKMLSQAFSILIPSACLEQTQRGKAAALHHIAWTFLWRVLLEIPRSILIPLPTQNFLLAPLVFEGGMMVANLSYYSQLFEEQQMTRIARTLGSFVLEWQEQWLVWSTPDQAEQCGRWCQTLRISPHPGPSTNLQDMPIAIQLAWASFGFFQHATDSFCSDCCTPCAILTFLLTYAQIGCSLDLDRTELNGVHDGLLPPQAIRWLLESSLESLLRSGWATALANAILTIRVCTCHKFETCDFIELRTMPEVEKRMEQTQCDQSEKGNGDHCKIWLATEILLKGGHKLDSLQYAGILLESLSWRSLQNLIDIQCPFWEVIWMLGSVWQAYPHGDITTASELSFRKSLWGYQKDLIMAELGHSRELVIPEADGGRPAVRVGVVAASLSTEVPACIPILSGCPAAEKHYGDSSRAHLEFAVYVHVGSVADYSGIKNGDRYCAVPSVYAANLWQFRCDFQNGFSSPAVVVSHFAWGTDEKSESRYCGDDFLHLHFGWVWQMVKTTVHGTPSLRVQCAVPFDLLFGSELQVTLRIVGGEYAAHPFEAFSESSETGPCWDRHGWKTEAHCFRPMTPPVRRSGASVPARLQAVSGSLSTTVSLLSAPGLKSRQMIVACTLPMFDFAGLEAALPGHFQSWLVYHLEVLGINHFQVYDVDGSFEAVLRPWITVGRVTYIPRFNDMISPDLFGPLSQKGECRGCLKGLACDHCLMSNRFRFHWVMLIRTFDKFVNSPAEGSNQDFSLFLARNWLDSPYLLLDVVDFGAARNRSSSEQHAVERYSKRCLDSRFEKTGAAIPIVRPEMAAYIGEHTAFVALGLGGRGHGWWRVKSLMPDFGDPFASIKPLHVPAEEWRANHYVDLFGRRCDCCIEEDRSLHWALAHMAF